LFWRDEFSRRISAIASSRHADVSARLGEDQCSLGAEDEASARHQAGCAIGDSCRRHSWVFKPFAGLIPSAGDFASLQSRACVPFD
jgi:hypothetical protein